MSDFDLEVGVRMFVPPIPIGALVFLPKPGKIGIFPMVLLYPYAVRAIFLVIPGMIVIVIWGCPLG